MTPFLMKRGFNQNREPLTTLWLFFGTYNRSKILTLLEATLIICDFYDNSKTISPFSVLDFFMISAPTDTVMVVSVLFCFFFFGLFAITADHGWNGAWNFTTFFYSKIVFFTFYRKLSSRFTISEISSLWLVAFKYVKIL